MRQDVDKAIEEYLRSGGTITKCPTIPLDVVIRERKLMSMGIKIPSKVRFKSRKRKY